MDVYSVIREAKDTKELLSTEELNKLFSPSLERTLFTIINNNENEDFVKLSEIILKKRGAYQEAKLKEKLDDFKDEIISDFKTILKKDKHEKLEEFFEHTDKVAEVANKYIQTAEDDPNSIIFKLFLNEYNTKVAFTWKAFKMVKKDFEKNHPLTGENIYNLKSLIEKYSDIEKIENNTVFSKESHTLSDKCLEKIKEKSEGQSPT